MKPSDFHGSVTYAEFEATKFRLKIIGNTKYLPLIIKTDSQEVIGLISKKKGAQTEIFWIIYEIQTSLKRLQQSRIQHTPKSCNGVAYSLAKTILEQDNVILWLENI